MSDGKKFEVISINRDHLYVYVAVRAASGRKMEYICAANAFYFTDEELRSEFESSPKAAAERYDATVDLI